MLALRLLLVGFFCLFVIACSNELDEPEVVSPDIPVIPPPFVFEDLPEFEWLFVGQYGCQTGSERSIVNFDPDIAVEPSTCQNNAVVDGSNPEQLFSLSDGLFRGLDTDISVPYTYEFVVFVNNQSVGLIDLRDNSGRRIANIEGTACNILAEEVMSLSMSTSTDQTWVRHHNEHVYIETVAQTESCDDASAFRTYVKVYLDDELDMEIVPESEARKVLVRGYQTDTSIAGPNNRVFSFGYLGWEGTESKLKFWDHTASLVWEREVVSEKFSTIDGPIISGRYIFSLTELSDFHYMLQLGEGVYTFPGELMFTAGSAAQELSDLIYEMYSLSNNQGVIGRYIDGTFDDDDLVLVDNGTVFTANYKVAYPGRLTSLAYTYNFDDGFSLVSSNLRTQVFSQFDFQDCVFYPNEAECDLANDVDSAAWNFLVSCDDSPSCSLSPDPYDDPANDVSFVGHIQYWDDYIERISFDFFDDKLIATIDLPERGVSLLVDVQKDLSAPKSERETILLGGRLNQRLMPAAISSDGIHYTSLRRDSFVSNGCFKSRLEVDCNLSSMDVGTSGECTGADVLSGSCRVGKYNYESRALFCDLATVGAGECNDDYQIGLPGNKRIQVEGDDQDAKWLPTIYVDRTLGVTKEMRVLVSDSVVFSSSDPLASFVQDEGVLGNPSLYKNDVVTNTLTTNEGTYTGLVESLGSAMVLFEGVGSTSVISEEFLEGRVRHQSNALYVDEPQKEIVEVTGTVLEP